MTSWNRPPIFSLQAVRSTQGRANEAHRNKDRKWQIDERNCVLLQSIKGFYSYLESLEKPWKYEALAAKMKEMPGM